MPQRIEVSKSGVNVLTATDPNDFIFHSDYNTFKIIKTGITSFTIADTAGVFVERTASHGLNYIPLVYAFAKFGTDTVVYAPNNVYTDFFCNALGNFSLCSDKTNVIFRLLNNTGGNLTIKIKYYCFEVPL